MKSNMSESAGTGEAVTADASADQAAPGNNSAPSVKPAASATGKSTPPPVGKKPKAANVGGAVDSVDMLWSALQYCLRDGYTVRMANKDGTPGVVIAIDGPVTCAKDDAGKAVLKATD